MPRHRRERAPRHRAQRVAGPPARRARLTAALWAPRTAFDSGLDGAAAAATEVPASAFRTAADGSAIAGAEMPVRPAGTVPDTSALAGAALTGSGLVGTRPDDLRGEGQDPADTGPDGTETTPLPVLIGTLPGRLDGAIGRLAGLAAPDHGVIDDSVLYGDAADNSALDDGAVGHRPPGRRSPSHSRRRSRRAVRPSAVGRPAAKQGGIVRGLLVTPWFAAATGFVIAASLWIYSPHPQLAFPAIAIGKVPCATYGCGSPVEKQGAGSLTINSGEPLTQRHKRAAHDGTATRGQTRTAASGLTFSYFVVPTAGGDNFALTVSVTGKGAIKNWHLAFVLRGDRIQYVMGAHWQAAGSDRGIASPITGDQDPQHGGSDGGYQGDYGYGPGDAHGQPGVVFTIFASGTPSAPTRCRFDGASCTFHKQSSASQGRR